MRLPDGCSVEWMRQPEKQNRLPEWLENHPHERKCLCHEQGYRDFNKTACAIKAAQAIFANDENPNNSHGVRLDPKPFAQSIRNHIRLVWTTKYQKVNAILGPIAARRAYSDFEPGSKILKIADAQIAKFPQWIQLHGYWRELPQFNQFADPEISSEPTDLRAPEKTDSQGMNCTSIELKSGAGRKRKRLQSEESHGADGASYVPSDSHDPPRPPRKNGRRSKFEGNKRRRAVASPAHREPGEDVTRIATNYDGAQQHNIDNAGSVGTAVVSQYTADQQFQLELAKIQRDMQVQHNKALEIAQKREVFIMLFGPKNA